MPIDNPQATAAPTSRRSFLARTAIGGALVTGGALVGPFGRILPAGAQEDGSTTTTAAAPTSAAPGEPPTDNDVFAVYAAPLELAVVQAYQNVLDAAVLDDEAARWARTFQTNHQTVADALAGYYPTDDPDFVAPPADADLVAEVAPLATVADQVAAATALAELEDALAATHLWALGGLEDTSAAKIVAQVMAAESQQAALWGRVAGTDLEALTPVEATIDAARTPGN